MKHTGKLFGSALCLALALSLGTAGASAAEAEQPVELEKITINTTVHGDGQKIESITLAVDDAATLAGLTAEDFTFTGKTYTWASTYVGEDFASPSAYRTTEAADFTASVTAVAVDQDADTVTLTIEDFSPKYYYVESYALTCSANEALSFENTIAVHDDMSFDNSDERVEVITPVADDFTYVSEPKSGDEVTDFNYFLYTPEDTSEPLPLVLSTHGSGDQMTLLANRVTLAWAEPGVQEAHPSYVLAPVYPQVEGSADGNEYQDEVIEKTIALIQEMIDDGKVDPDRIYIEGKSMGGGNTVKIAYRYPDFFAAAMPLCCTNSTGESFETVAETLKDLPMYFIVGEEDGLAENSLGFYDAIQAAGGYKAKIHVYSPEQMMARGVGKAHDVEIISLEDGRYFDWMFSQVKEQPDAVIDYIRVDTVSAPRGHTIDTITVYVNDPAVLEGIDSPEDFQDAKLTGTTYNWASTIYEGEYRSDTTVPFEAQITGVSVDGNALTLTFAPLKGYVDDDPEQGVDETFAGFKKYFYVDTFTVTCTANEDLSFTKDMVGDTVCEQADAFSRFTAQHTAAFDYNLYTPAGYVEDGVVKEALPLVLVLHGSGDQENLLANRMAVSWTEPEVQEQMPCYVLAPVYTKQAEVADQEATTAQAVDFIQSMIDSGMVDPDRVYVMGKSMGGKNTLRAYTTYPDFFAAAMPLSGGHPFEDQLAEKVAIIKDKPIYIIHSEGDSSTEQSDALFAELQAQGNEQALYKRYTPEEFFFDGLAVKPHDTEIIVAEDISFKEWLMAQSLSGEAPAEEAAFTDVAADAWYAGAVAQVTEKGLMNGTSETTFSPEVTMDRSMLVTTLWRAMGSPEAEPAAFSDVEAGTWYADAVDWAVANGITSGTGEETFSPTAPVTREQVAVFLYNCAGAPEADAAALDSFADAASVNDWAADAMAWAVGNGIISGTGTGALAPQGSATRAEVATILVRSLDILGI